MTADDELELLHPSNAAFGPLDRRLMLSMSKAIVAIGTSKNEDNWATDLAIEQYSYRQKFFPETLDEEG